MLVLPMETSGQTCLCGTLARQHAAGYFFVEGVSAGDVSARRGRQSRSLLLQHLKNEQIDWARVTDDLLGPETQSRSCRLATLARVSHLWFEASSRFCRRRAGKRS